MSTTAGKWGPHHAAVTAALCEGYTARQLGRLRSRLGADADPAETVAALPRSTNSPTPGVERGVVAVLGDRAFPEPLAESWTSGGPLWIRIEGQVAAVRSRPAVAIVGARRPTLDGLQIAARMAEELGRCGVTIVSGMARGIDQAAHRGALAADARTVAVLGTGLAVNYPAGSGPLRAAVTVAGALVSELADDHRITNPAQFLARNRILAGLADAVVVIDAGQRSGALNTASWAADMGRTVAAVPASPSTTAAAGSLALLRDGATPVRHAEDVLELLDPVVLRPQQPAAAEHGARPADSDIGGLMPVARRMLGLLGAQPAQPAALADVLGCATSEALAAIGQLQQVGLAHRTEAGVVAGRRPGRPG